jgi:flagellar protein FlaJ
MYSTKGNYGVLTPEIKKIARQISWGSSVDEALYSFAKRVNTKLITRTISLIIEANRSGGNVADVLEAASKDAKELKFIESERRVNMLSYVAVIYVGMFVFLVIIIILTHNFLPSMYIEESESAINAPKIELQTLNNLFLYATIIQSTGMGIVAGVFEEGNIISGIKHIFIMILITWLIFKVFIGV